MPILESNYKPSIFFRNGFIATVYSGLYRKVKGVEQQRERIILSDNDFLDLDWSYSAKRSSKLVIMLHGLEGDGQRPYMLGVSKLFNDNGFAVVCVNFSSRFFVHECLKYFCDYPIRNNLRVREGVLTT